MDGYLPLLAASPLLLFMGAEDLRKLRISNFNVMLLAGIFAGFCWILGGQEALLRLLAAGVVFLMCFGLFCAGLIAGGDAKMLPAAVLFVPAGSLVLFAFSFSAALLGITGLVFCLQRLPSAALPEWQAARQRGRVPMGLAIALAVLALPVLELMQA